METPDTPANARRVNVWRKHYAVPPEHGAWFWLLGPLALGVAAAGRVTPDLLVLLAAALIAFLARQPVTLLAKVLSGRRGRADLAPALFWLGVYGVAGIATATGLVWLGHAKVLTLALPGLPVFAVFLWLVTRKEERGQMALEIIGAAVLALTAPAAYWTCGGADTRKAWILYALATAFIAASIVSTYWRLAMRRLKTAPPLASRWRSAAPGLAFHTINLLATLMLAAAGIVPALTPAAFTLGLLDAAEGVFGPPIGVKPSRIGIRQLIVSVLFVLVLALAYRT